MKEKLRVFLMAITVITIAITWAVGVSVLMELGYYLIGVILMILGLAGYAMFMLVGL